MMRFSQALEQLKKNHHIRRTSWENPDLSVSRVGNPVGMHLGRPTYAGFFQLNIADGEIFDWNPTAEDIAATDWEVC